MSDLPWDISLGMAIRWKVAQVEDDRRLARAVATGLGEEGYTVRAAGSAARGLELAFTGTTIA